MARSPQAIRKFGDMGWPDVSEDGRG